MHGSVCIGYNFSIFTVQWCSLDKNNKKELIKRNAIYKIAVIFIPVWLMVQQCSPAYRINFFSDLWVNLGYIALHLLVSTYPVQRTIAGLI